MEERSSNLMESGESLDLVRLIKLLWQEKKRIIKFTIPFAIFSVIYSLLLPNQYTATTVLAPSSDEAGGLSSSIGTMSGLSSFVGVRIRGESTESKVAQEIMQSWNFVSNFIDENNLAVEIYASSGWDKKNNILLFDDDIYDIENKEWVLEDRETGLIGPPSSYKLWRAFDRKISIVSDKLSGFVTISVTHYSPKRAKEILDLYVSAINRFMQERQVEKVDKNIAYLQEEIKKTPITEMQEVLYTIIEEQIKSKMITQASPDHTFVSVNPSMIPEKKSAPSRALICIFFTFIGGIISVIYVLNHHFRGS